ncbi:MAG TPA: DUF1289 domain-containing protein [Rhizomicrobium sp.]|nr:DUF1289 domain-containing protein [Rhizomicrobium sp.]
MKICTYDPGTGDPGTGLCLGCGRTLEEIAAWSALGDAERRAVMEQLPERLRQMSSPAN